MSGGLPARRALVRWAWRAFRREWRQQALIVLLLAFTVAGSLLQISALYSTGERPEARFGWAGQRVDANVSDHRQVPAILDAARAAFATFDVIGHREVPLPGLTRTVDLRAQDPAGAYGAPMLSLLRGRYPTGSGEAAVTDEVARLLRLEVGGSVTLAGRSWTVVGLVENPHALPEEFVLVPPAYLDQSRTVTILAAAPASTLDRFRPRGDISVMVQQRDDDDRTIVAATMLGFVAVAMLLVCFVAVAAFHTMAQRRRRQFGLLAATGATERHLRLVLLAAGAVVGALAAALGLLLAAPLWTVVVPGLETAAGHRIDPLDLPWWLLGACLGLAVLAATGAAWWPARVAARQPVTQALSMRPPPPKPAHRSAVVGLVLVAAGAVSLRLAHQDTIALIVGGTIATVVGLPFLSPLAIRLLAAAGARSPVGVRLALRDLARHRARSGAALAAIALALAVPAVVVIATAAQETAARRRASAGNLSDRQLLIHAGRDGGQVLPDRTPAQLAALDEAVRRLATTLDARTLIGLDAAMHPDTRTEPGNNGRPPVNLVAFTRTVSAEGVGLTIETPPGTTGRLYLGRPDLLAFLGLGADAFGAGTEVLTAGVEGDLRLFFVGAELGPKTDPMRPTLRTIRPPVHTSLPDSLLNPAVADAHGWTSVRAGWLIEAAAPLTTDQLARAQALAVDHDLIVETRDEPTELALVRVGATAGGGVLALGILAMTIGLIRGEAASDLRTLTATGATGRTRRTLTAATAGGLTGLGAVLGTAVAYVALAAGYDRDVGLLGRVPVLDLLGIVVGVPVVAAVAGWLLAGREPRTLTRQP